MWRWTGALLAPLLAVSFLSPGLAHAQAAARLTAPEAGPVPNALLGDRPVPTLERLELANGLEVLLEPVAGVGRVGVAISYAVGHRDQPEGYRGLAHLTEHLMFSGTRYAGEDGFFRYAEQAGATEYNATTSDDRTNYFCVVPAHQLETILWLESDRLAYLLGYLRDEHVAVQQQVVLREHAERIAGDILGPARPAIWAQLFPRGHPYRDSLERPQDVRAIQLPEVQTFFQRHYAPDRATLALVGGFDRDAAVAMVERYFGPIVRSGPAVPRLTHEDVPGGTAQPATILLRSPRLFDAMYYFWRTPRWGEVEDGYLDLLAHSLAGTRASRLPRRLLPGGLAQAVSARQVSQELASYFVIRLMPGPAGTVGALRASVDEELRALAMNPPDGREMQLAQDRFLSSLQASAADIGWRATLVAISPTMAGIRPGEHPFALDLRRYGSATPARLGASAARWLDPGQAVVLVVQNDPRAPEDGLIQVIR